MEAVVGGPNHNSKSGGDWHGAFCGRKLVEPKKGPQRKLAGFRMPKDPLVGFLSSSPYESCGDLVAVAGGARILLFHWLVQYRGSEAVVVEEQS